MCRWCWDNTLSLFSLPLMFWVQGLFLSSSTSWFLWHSYQWALYTVSSPNYLLLTSHSLYSLAKDYQGSSALQSNRLVRRLANDPSYEFIFQSRDLFCPLQPPRPFPWPGLRPPPAPSYLSSHSIHQECTPSHRSTPSCLHLLPRDGHCFHLLAASPTLSLSCLPVHQSPALHQLTTSLSVPQGCWVAEESAQPHRLALPQTHGLRSQQPSPLSCGLWAAFGFPSSLPEQPSWSSSSFSKPPPIPFPTQSRQPYLQHHLGAWTTCISWVCLPAPYLPTHLRLQLLLPSSPLILEERRALLLPEAHSEPQHLPPPFCPHSVLQSFSSLQRLLSLHWSFPLSVFKWPNLSQFKTKLSLSSASFLVFSPFPPQESSTSVSHVLRLLLLLLHRIFSLQGHQWTLCCWLWCQLVQLWLAWPLCTTYLTPSIWLLQHASLCFPFYPSDCSSRLPFWASLPLPVPYTLAFPKGFWSSCWHSLLKGFIHSHGFNYDVYAGNLITYDSFSRSISQGWPGAQALPFLVCIKFRAWNSSPDTSLATN